MVQTTTKLYRGCKIKFPHLVVNENFLFKQFTSTTLLKEKAEDFMQINEENKKGINGTLFIVEGIQQGTIGNRSVIGLINHAAFPDESEVLTDPFQVFVVTNIKEVLLVGNSITEVYLQATN